MRPAGPRVGVGLSGLKSAASACMLFAGAPLPAALADAVSMCCSWFVFVCCAVMDCVAFVCSLWCSSRSICKLCSRVRVGNKWFPLAAQWYKQSPHPVSPCHVLAHVDDVRCWTGLKKRRVDTTTSWILRLMTLLPASPVSPAELKAAIDLPVSPLPVSTIFDVEPYRDLFCVDDDAVGLHRHVHACLSDDVHLERGASEIAQAGFLDCMLILLLKLALTKSGVAFTWNAHVQDTSGLTASSQRPDQCGWMLQLLVFKGELKKDRAEFNTAVGELTSKMVATNPLLFGQLPFVFAYAAAADTVQFFALCPRTLQKHALSGILVLDEPGTRVRHRVQAERVVLNMARVLLTWQRDGRLTQPRVVWNYRAGATSDSDRFPRPPAQAVGARHCLR